VASDELRGVIETALNTRSAEERRAKKLQLQTAIKKFNRNPEKGIEYLVAHGLNEGTPADIANFLRNTSGLNKTAAGDYLSDLPEICRLTLRCFLDQLTFAGNVVALPLVNRFPLLAHQD
jgi:Sec7-like guanine-nucleotide exchange factor